MLSVRKKDAEMTVLYFVRDRERLAKHNVHTAVTGDLSMQKAECVKGPDNVIVLCDYDPGFDACVCSFWATRS